MCFETFFLVFSVFSAPCLFFVLHSVLVACIVLVVGQVAQQTQPKGDDMYTHSDYAYHPETANYSVKVHTTVNGETCIYCGVPASFVTLDRGYCREHIVDFAQTQRSNCYIVTVD